MNTVREYRSPLLIAAGALVVALLLYAIVVSPQASKLSSLHNQETQLQSQQVGLDARLAALKSEKQNLTQSCTELEKIATQIPSVQSPTDVDAEESSFESQFNGLAETSGVTLTQFSGFAPATTASAPVTPTAGTAAAKSGVVAVPTTLTVTGDYAKMTAFINGLDSFPRLFVIQTFDLAYGAGSSNSNAGATTSPTTPSSNSPSDLTSSAPALWLGGTPTSPSAGPYSLAITGSIYYTSTPNALAACTKAAASVS
jgi:Tfp pilus assembly protein PilO